MTHKQFKKWFWDAMSEFVDMSYRPPGMDKLRDSDAWQGFYAVLEDEDCEKKFLENVESRPTHFCEKCNYETTIDPAEAAICPNCEIRMSPFRIHEHK